jgi:hypothetical protein
MQRVEERIGTVTTVQYSTGLSIAVTRPIARGSHCRMQGRCGHLRSPPPKRRYLTLLSLGCRSGVGNELQACPRSSVRRELLQHHRHSDFDSLALHSIPDATSEVACCLFMLFGLCLPFSVKYEAYTLFHFLTLLLFFNSNRKLFHTSCT